MANSAHKINQFIAKNKVATGVLFNSRTKFYQVICWGNQDFAVIQLANEALNNDKAKTIIKGYGDAGLKAMRLLELNGVTAILGNDAPRGGKLGNFIKVVTMPEIINY